MTVEMRKDTVGQFVNLGRRLPVPSIDTKNVITQIAVNNGDTAVIGGIYEEDDHATTSTKVPFLGDMPVLGYLFKHDRHASSEKTELLIFLTPRIVQGNGRRRCAERIACLGSAHVARRS